MSKTILVPIEDFLTSVTRFKICETKSEARKLVKQGGIRFNKEKISPNTKWVMIDLDEDGKWTSVKRVEKNKDD